MNVKAMRGRDDDGPMIHLGHEHIRKLGINADAGDEVEFHGKGRLRSTSEHADDKEGAKRHWTMEITHMGAERKGGPSVRETVEKSTDGWKDKC